MRLLALAGDVQATIAEIRLGTPLTALAARMGWRLQLKSFHDCTPADLAQADVLVVQRAASRRAWRMQHRVRQQGGTVIYEIDDLLTEIAAHISQYAVVRERLPWLHRCMAQADGVTVATALLGRTLQLDGALVVPNYALSLGDAPPPEFDGMRPVTLLLASSDHLASDFIVPALRGVAGPGVEVVVVGPPGAALAAAGVPLRQQPLMPRRQFVEFARSLPNPLAVIPLEDTRFAACKSAIKWFDYAEAGVPALCSAVSPYREVIQDDHTGALVPNDADSWAAALTRAIGDAAWRRQVTAAARADVRRRFTLDATVDAWQAAIAESVRRRVLRALPALTWGERVQVALGDVLEGGLLRVRGFNRARLARRRSPPR